MPNAVTEDASRESHHIDNLLLLRAHKPCGRSEYEHRLRQVAPSHSADCRIVVLSLAGGSIPSIFRSYFWAYLKLLCKRPGNPS